MGLWWAHIFATRQKLATRQLTFFFCAHIFATRRTNLTAACQRLCYPAHGFSSLGGGVAGEKKKVKRQKLLKTAQLPPNMTPVQNDHGNLGDSGRPRQPTRDVRIGYTRLETRLEAETEVLAGLTVEMALFAFGTPPPYR